jgi:peptide chain release factor 1
MQLPLSYSDFDIQSARVELARIETELQNPNATKDMQKFTALSIDYTSTKTLVNLWEEIAKTHSDYTQAEELLADPDMAEMAANEIKPLESKLTKLLAEFDKLTLPKLPDDEKGVLLEFRAGTGGVEAALFAEEMYRMYLRYLNSKGYSVEEISVSYQTEGGIKEATCGVNRPGAFGQLRFEAGVHRVQRVPKTEAAGRIHTSAISIAVLPIVETSHVQINPSDLRIEVYRSSGPGGQSVNTTDSAVRITHIPTGLTVACQDNKSQHKNKERAMSILAAKLYNMEQAEAAAKSKDLRSAAIGDGDRSAKIRTFNFPQGRITDHRIKQSWYNLPEVMEGNLDDIVTTVNAQLRQNPTLSVSEDDE